MHSSRQNSGFRFKFCRRKFAAGLLLVAALAAIFLLRVSPKTSSPHLLYLGWASDDHIQIFRASLDKSDIEQLTMENSDVQDYALSPDYSQIAYSTLDGENSQLWLIDHDGRGRRPILTCERAYCDSIAWHPNGQRLIYERRDVGDEAFPGITHLWWLDIVTLATAPVLENREQPSHGASFSPNGQWLSYVGAPDDGIFIFNFETGQHAQFASEVGTKAVWSPDGQKLVLRNHQLIVTHSTDDGDHQEHSHAFAIGIHLFLVDVSEDTVVPLGIDGYVDDGAPAWQPGGDWIAFGRKQPLTSMGRQLWLISADGSDAHALTNDPAIHHGVPTWTDDGKALLFQRYPILEPNAQPAIWIYELDSGKMREIVSSGYQPSWLP